MLLPSILKKGTYTEPKSIAKYSKFLNEGRRIRFSSVKRLAHNLSSISKNDYKPLINIIPRKNVINPILGYSEWEERRKAYKDEYKNQAKSYILNDSRNSSPKLERM